MAVDGQVWSGPRAVLVNTTFLVIPFSFFEAVTLCQSYSRFLTGSTALPLMSLCFVLSCVGFTSS